MKKISTMQAHFNVYNKLYFGGRLGKTRVVWKRNRKNIKWLAITWSAHGKVETGKRTFVIELDWSIRHSYSMTVLTLLHEMVHVEQWDEVSKEESHGSVFQARMRELAAKGAFDGLW